MITRLSSGLPRLDRVLGGGLPADAINLVIGAPGTGKTILCQQYVYQNATPERPAVYFSTVSEPFDKILRYAGELEFFDPARVGSAVFYEDLGSILHRDGLNGALARIDEVIRERRPGLMVVDSFKALNVFSSDEGEFRRFLHDLAGRLSALAISSFWTGEYTRREETEGPEFAVADAIISMSSRKSLARESRVLEVLKLRGSGYASGEHAYRLSNRGIDVFPRLADRLDEHSYPLNSGRGSTGLEALDELLAHGYWPGSSTLIAGPAGVGKTLMGMHYVFSGASAGEPGVIATLQENETQLQRILEGFGWSLEEPGVSIISSSPVDIGIDEWFYKVMDRVEESGARRLLIDSITDLMVAAEDEVRFREWMYSLIQRCSRMQVSLMMTMETSVLFNITRLEGGMSHLSDNALILQYHRAAAEVKRTVTVLKTRASDHDPHVREFRITRDGIVLGEPLAPPPV
ncbi:MAG: ATPase domain-containing protein [Candidatus Dormibacteria bacterium]